MRIEKYSLLYFESTFTLITSWFTAPKRYLYSSLPRMKSKFNGAYTPDND